MKTDFQVSYFLWRDREDKDGFAPVYIRSKQNSKAQVSINTGVRIHKSQWPPRDKGKKRKQFKPLKNLPVKLVELTRKIKETYADRVAQGYSGDDLALDKLWVLKDGPHSPTDKNIVAWCKDYDKSTKYSEGQRKAVRTLKTNIKEFRPGLTFDKLRTPMLDKFFDHLAGQKVANNSAYKRLRALVNVARHAGQNIPDLLIYRIPYSTKNALKVRLNWPEVKKVMETETTGHLEAIAKDVFLLACFSGLRISDILTIQRGELHEYHYERIQTKTKTTVMVTLHKYNTDLLRKFMDNGIPYTRQTLSKALKDVLERSGMTREVTRHQQVGNNYKEVTVKKFKEISFHSGRRFYSRLLNDLGLGGEIARDELGHSFKNVTELYSGSQEHRLRVTRVRAAMDGMEKTLEEQEALMKVAS